MLNVYCLSNTLDDIVERGQGPGEGVVISADKFESGKQGGGIMRADRSFICMGLSICFLLVVGAIPLSATDSPTGFALDLGFNNLAVHRLDDFPGQVILGPQAGNYWGIDFDESAKTLYAIHGTNNEFGVLSLVAGVFSLIGSAGETIPAEHSWTGLAIDPADGTIYASSADANSSSLYTVNRATGEATLIGGITNATTIIDISINCDGEMYGHDISDDAIYTINPSTGEGTQVGSTGLDSNFAQGIDFDNSSGILYAWTYQGNMGDNQFGTINLNTGAFTAISAINTPRGQFEGATQTCCDCLQINGFETGAPGLPVSWTVTP